MNDTMIDDLFVKSIEKDSIKYTDFSVEYKSKEVLAKNHADFFLKYLNGLGKGEYSESQNLRSGFEKINPNCECYDIKKDGYVSLKSFFVLFEPESVPSFGKPVKVSIQTMGGETEILEQYAAYLTDLSTGFEQE